MKVSMTLPTMVSHDRAQFLEWCRRVDEASWPSLAVPERITYPSHDLTVELAGAAALTERVRLVSTIVILPAHDAVAVAKQMASVDVLSGGRLTVGVGVGGREHDYQAIGAPFDRRWQRMDQQVATMRRIWAGEPPFEGADPVGPPPVQPGGPPIIAGVMGPKAIARAAHWADGVDGAWTMDGSLEHMQRSFAHIREAWRAAGRAEPPQLSSSIWYALGPGAEERLRALRVRLPQDLRRGGRHGVGRSRQLLHRRRVAPRSGERARGRRRRVLPRAHDPGPRRARPHHRCSGRRWATLGDELGV